MYEIPRTVFEESLEKTSFNVLGMDLLTSTAINGNLAETLKSHYKLIYHEDHLMRGGYLSCKKRLCGIQARKRIIGGCLEWWFLDRMSRKDIFTTLFWNFPTKPCVFVVKFQGGKNLVEVREVSTNARIASFGCPSGKNLSSSLRGSGAPSLSIEKCLRYRFFSG